MSKAHSQGRELLTVVDLQAGFERLLGGDAPAAICEELALNPRDFTQYVKDRVVEISERDNAHQKAFVFARLETFLASIWGKRSESAQWAAVVLKTIAEQSKLIMGNAVAVDPSKPARIGDVVDMKRVHAVARDHRERKRIKAES